MLHLMKMEIKKNPVNRMITGIVIIDLILIWIIFTSIKSESIGLDFLIQIIDSVLIIVCCMVPSTLYCSYVIKDYNKSYFTFYNRYPIRRSKIVISKVLLVLLLSFIIGASSYILVTGGVLLLCKFNLIVYQLDIHWYYDTLWHLCILTLGYNIIGLIASFVSILTNSRIMMLSVAAIVAIMLCSIGDNVFGNYLNSVGLALMIFSIIQIILSITIILDS